MTRILYFSIIIWILVDRFKKAWEEYSWGGYLTSAVALLMGAAVSFSYNLDMLYELELVDHISIIGKIMTAISFMGGSSVINEILERKPTLMMASFLDQDYEEEEEEQE